MDKLIVIVPIAASAYIATNLDNLVLLVALLARYRRQNSFVIAGYLACMLLLGFVGFLIGRAANTVSVEYLGLLGFVPVSIGLVGIMRLFRTTALPGPALRAATATAGAVFAATFLSQLGNGSDTVLTFGVLFADSLPSADLLIIATLAATAVGFVFIAKYTVQHPKLSDVIEAYAHRVTPFILIAVGIYIVSNTVTDVMPG